MARSRPRDQHSQQALVPIQPTAANASPPRRERDRNGAIQPIRPEVTVLDASGNAPDANATRSALAATIARAAIDLAPDVIRAIDGARTRRGAANATSNLPATLLQAAQMQPVAPTAPVYTRSTRITEREYDLRTPLVRRVVVREATSWESLMPSGAAAASVSQAVEAASGEPGRWKRAGLVSIGGALAVAALGVLANRTRS